MPIDKRIGFKVSLINSLVSGTLWGPNPASYNPQNSRDPALRECGGGLTAVAEGCGA
jgi:hypothetical protein